MMGRLRVARRFEYRPPPRSARLGRCPGDLFHPRLGRRAAGRASSTGAIRAPRATRSAATATTHRLIYEPTPDEFRADLRLGLRHPARHPRQVVPTAYRAPRFSITRRIRPGGTRHPRRRRHHPRLEHLPDAPRPLRHPRNAAPTAPHRPRGRLALGVPPAGVERPRLSPPRRRRRLLPPLPLRPDAVRLWAGSTPRAGRSPSTCTRGNSTPSSRASTRASAPAASALRQPR